ncbi:MAG TPA: exodeoxyribonuclease III [Gammaproteobacteria bacterium]|jgi:exodeoxyribonuclease-3|nr:exodeoxyribonuclease III [Gammaproteobacteria bacterium]HJM09698.1 exodeoxyribonuclease III [Gammaproteobacteria bacterium]HJN00203.1 exodeoxyribonuclease III [Gammaproteobacteria bacterium]|tara:strand:- start:5300 stop:6097 length:798 start_codon:yes stop_codon:yes gene_type:complete
MKTSIKVGEKHIKIISLNVNGIRAANKKGVFSWLNDQDADIVCLQEVRAQVEDIPGEEYWPENYHCFHKQAVKKGYSGVAIFTKKEPETVSDSLGAEEFDQEGRYIECTYQDLIIASAYFPSGSSGDARQEAKYRFLDFFEKKLVEYNKKKTAFVFCGDINIVHKEIDIKNWKSNQKNSGCLPEERAWLDKIFEEHGCTDAFRSINKDADEYTWWSNRGNAYNNNVGWRIDYQIYNKFFTKTPLRASVYKVERFSDHAPLIVEYE